MSGKPSSFHQCVQVQLSHGSMSIVN
jgi:hypothetical protein